MGAVAERIANRGLALIRREPRSGWAEGLVGFREHAIGLLRRRWLWLTLATLLGHLTVFLVLFASLRTIGVSSAEVSGIEAFAAWSLIRIVTSIPITPGAWGSSGSASPARSCRSAGPRSRSSPRCSSTACSRTCRRSRSAASLLVWRRLPERETDEPAAAGEPSAGPQP